MAVNNNPYEAWQKLRQNSDYRSTDTQINSLVRQQLSQDEDPNGFWLFDLGANYRFSEQHGRIFARVDNILDRDFTYLQTRGLEPQVLEGRSFIVGVHYNFW